jgi:hypothetical protein
VANSLIPKYSVHSDGLFQGEAGCWRRSDALGSRIAWHLLYTTVSI